MSEDKKFEDWHIEILRLLAYAKHIRDKYNSVCHDDPPYSVDDYLEIIQQFTSTEIDLREMDWGSKGYIRGMCLPFEGNKAVIRVPKFKDDVASGGATECERRYITLKEISHLVVDEEDSYVDDCLALVNTLVFNSSYAVLDELDKDGRSDVFYGKIFAMELLFPAELRDGVIEEISKGLSTYDAAKRFMIPEKELIWFLSDKIHPALQYFRKEGTSMENIYLKKIHPEIEG